MISKKILPVALVIAMLVSLGTGCTPNTTAPQTTGAQGAATTPAGASQPASTAADTSGDNELYEFTLMQNFVGEITVESQAYFDKLQETLNLKIDFQVPPSSNYAEALQIMLASTDYPEAVLFPGTTDTAYQDAVKNGLLLSLTPYLADYGQNILNYSYEVSLDALKATGNEDIYGIPRTSVTRADGLLVRKDWADNLGIELPEEGAGISREKFLELLEKFSKNDPDGNGQDDTFGLKLVSTGGVLTPHQLVLWSHGLLGWQETDGGLMDLQYSRNHDNYKRALAFMNTCWEAGYFDPDWPSLDESVASQRVNTGMYGMLISFAGYIDSINAGIKELNPNGEFIWFKGVENDQGKVVGSSASSGFWGFTSLMTSAEKPERIIGMYDYMLSDDGWTELCYGVEGVSWVLDGNGNRVLAHADVEESSAWQRNTVRRSTDPSFFVQLAVPPERRSVVEDLIQLSIDLTVFSLDAGYVAPATLELNYIDMKSEYDKTVTKIIVGDLPVDAYDALLEEYWANGYQEVHDQIVAYIQGKQ